MKESSIDKVEEMLKKRIEETNLKIQEYLKSSAEPTNDPQIINYDQIQIRAFDEEIKLHKVQEKQTYQPI